MRVLYTDGSASPNPGPGGFAVVGNGKPIVLGSEEGDTTNIRMEGLALCAAMEHSGGKTYEIHTDSEFWINVITKWAPGWREKGWKKKGGEIKNIDIVQRALELYETNNVKLVWVRGHEGNNGNELADEWANKAREGKRV